MVRTGRIHIPPTASPTTPNAHSSSRTPKYETFKIYTSANHPVGGDKRRPLLEFRDAQAYQMLLNPALRPLYALGPVLVETSWNPRACARVEG